MRKSVLAISLLYVLTGMAWTAQAAQPGTLEACVCPAQATPNAVKPLKQVTAIQDPMKAKPKEEGSIFLKEQIYSW